MARVDLAAGLLFLSVVIAVSAHPPHAAGVSSSRQVHQLDSDSWRRLGDHDDEGVDPVPDDWSAGFGRRLSVIQRRTGSSLQPQQQQEQQVVEASTKLMSVSQQLRPKAEGSSTAAGIKAEASTIRLIRKRLPENRSPSVANKTGPEESVVNATVVNETVQPSAGEVTEETFIPSDTTNNATSIHNGPEVANTRSIPETVAINSTTEIPTSTSATSVTSSTTVAPSNKPPWRVRMELNQSNRRVAQSTAKPTGSEENSEPISITTALPIPSIAEVRNVTLPVPSIVPSVESSQSDHFSSSSTVSPLVASSSNPPRPIQSTRIVSFSSTNSPAWTPIVRLPSTGNRNIPAGTLKIQITSTRLAPPVVAATEPKLLEPEEENDVKNSQTIPSSAPSRSMFTSTTSTVAPVTTTTTTEQATTTTTTTRKPAPPTPVMHSLEDILQRLVPAREDSFGGNPFLVAPVAYHPAVSSEDANEIVSVGESRSGGSARINDNLQGRKNSSGSSTDSSETQTTTSIYVVGVVAVIPLAGIVLWIVRVQLHKRRERLNESETSSETGFRKRLPPVALTPSKHARLFYGGNDKEDLVSSSVSCGGNSGGGKSSPAPSPWEFTRSRLRLQTLIGEGNFGQVWKAEAEDICGCQGTLLVAVKTVKDGAAAKEKQELLREMRIMQQVGPHPNVVALLGCCTEQEPFLLIMEYVMYGRLLTFLRDHRTHQTYYNYSTDSEALTSRDLTTFAYCVAKGMEYIYSKGVVHRDLAARNVLVDHNKLCKVADFGLSRSVRDTAGEMYEQRVKGALPIRWMAPESLIQSVFTQKSDVWSFGILVWEIVTLGSTPYPGMEAREVMRRVKDGHRLERPSHCRPEFYRLMSRCWHSDPQRRPDFGELKAELGRLLDDADGYIDLDNFQESIYVPLESPSDESEKV